MNYIIRPLGTWTDPVTENRRGSHVFRATWDDTLKLLERELDYLGADQAIFQIDVTEGELRRDGMLRTHATVRFPGVRVSFNSIHGWRALDRIIVVLTSAQGPEHTAWDAVDGAA